MSDGDRDSDAAAALVRGRLMEGERVSVFHAGALGDFVLIWPFLRALRRGGAEVTVVTHGAKARLAERELGVRGVDIEQRVFSELWMAREEGAGREVPAHPALPRQGCPIPMEPVAQAIARATGSIKDAQHRLPEAGEPVAPGEGKREKGRGKRGGGTDRRTGRWHADHGCSDSSASSTLPLSPDSCFLSPSSPLPSQAIVSFVADETSAAGRVWVANARWELVAENVVCVGPPVSASRAAAWAWARVAELGGVGARENPDGRIVFHVGAGSREKVWPMGRWAELYRLMFRENGAGGIPAAVGTTAPPIVLAGEVEAERFTAEERRVFESLGGVFERDVCALADTIKAARLFVGADTGPTHLAAQLGVPTLALFGPTDPGVWGPVGARVRVVNIRGPMAAMGITRVSGAARSLMGSSRC